MLSDRLVAMAKADERVVILTGDHGYALFDALRSQAPDRYINCGVAEQNMVGVAAGLAKAGFRPIVYGLAAFVPIRVLEQIKIDVCYENLPVIFLGDGAGMVYSHLGNSHQSFEDIAAVRSLPNIEVYSPADRFELSWSLSAAFEAGGPAYLRIGKADLGDVHGGDLPESGTGLFPVIDNGVPDLCIATGSMVRLAANVIGKGNLPYDLFSVSRLKRAAERELIQICQNRRRIRTLEEHSIYGGLGSLIAELIAGKAQCDFRIGGIRDKFPDKCGTYHYLLKLQGLDEPSLAAFFS